MKKYDFTWHDLIEAWAQVAYDSAHRYDNMWDKLMKAKKKADLKDREDLEAMILFGKKSEKRLDKDK